MEDFVSDARPVLEDKWLAQDHESLNGVVEGLWRRNRDGYRLPSTRLGRYCSGVRSSGFTSPLSAATFDEHEGDTIDEHRFVTRLSPSCS